MTYGERFRVLRRQWCKAQKKPVLALADKFGSPYPATIYNIERSWRVPPLPTLMTHATALDCRPWDLLIDVETEYDIVRKFAAMEKREADEEWNAILRRYKESARTKPQRQTLAKKGRRSA